MNPVLNRLCAYRQTLGRRSGALLLAFAAVSVWITQVLAALVGVAPPPVQLTIPPEVVSQVTTLRIVSTHSYQHLTVQYQDRQDIQATWEYRQDRAPTWRVEGKRLIFLLPGGGGLNQLSLPLSITQLEGAQFDVSLQPNQTLPSLSLVVGEAFVQGAIGKLDIALGFAECPPPTGKNGQSERFPRTASVRLATTHTTSVSVRADAGSRLTVEKMPSLESFQLAAEDGVGLEVSDLKLLNRLQVTQPVATNAEAPAWKPAACPTPKPD